MNRLALFCRVKTLFIMWLRFCRRSYLHTQDYTFAQDFAEGHFVVVVALEGLFLQKLACGQVEGFTWPVKPATIQPLLTFKHKYKQNSVQEN